MAAQQPYEPGITEEQRKTITAQQVFFVATAGPTGPVNVSPRGHDCVRILSDDRVAWVDYPGSVNETAESLAESDRITLLFCDLVGTAYTVRLFGRGRAVLPSSPEFDALLARMEIAPDPIVRQIFVVDLRLTSNSCGSGVPVFTFEREGALAAKWHKTSDAGKLDEVAARIALPRPRDVIDSRD